MAPSSRAWIGAALATWVLACGHRDGTVEKTQPRTFQVAYQSAVHGEIEPCG